MNTLSLDGTEIGYFLNTYEPDLKAFRMPNRYYWLKSCSYHLMQERYSKLNNTPRFAGEVIPLGEEYANLEFFING